MNLGLAIRQSALASDFFPRYFNMVSAGIVFSVIYPGAAMTASSATTTSAFALFNPANSGVNLAILTFNPVVVGFTASTGGAGIGFQFVPGQQPTATTPGNTPQNALVGSSATSKANTFVAGTLVGAPTTTAYYSTNFYMDLAAGDFVTPKDEIAGTVVISPNSGLCVVGSGGTGISLAPTLTWAEIPLG